MSIEERIAKVSNKELMDSVNFLIKEGWVEAMPAAECIVRSYGFDYKDTSMAEDDKIVEDFFRRFAHHVTITGEVEEAVKMQLILGIACDIAILFTSLGETTEIPSERLITFAEKIVERVRNA